LKSITEVVKTVKRPEKILQFGEGNFLRAFVDWQVDLVNEKTAFNGNVVVVQPLEQGLSDMINSQNGLYTTVLRGVQDGKITEEFRTITSISRCLNPYTQYDDYIKCAENPDLRFVISNTTEAGISYGAGDTRFDKPQRSFPGKVTAFLYRRFAYFKGDETKALVFIPCELIEKNGDKLKELVERYAAEWNLGSAFGKWLETCDFCNSLVDRIVPGYPKEEAEALCQKIGYTDNLLDAAEIFHLWVIETRRDYRAELPFVQVGLNVIWTDDMSFYRTRKVRILNGAHTLSVPAAFLYGLDTVEACIKDPTIAGLMKQGIFEEIIPSMDGNTGELTQYAKDVLERFANPYIRHLLLSITLNSISKYKTRVLPSLLDYQKKKGKLPRAITLSFAALIAFYNGKNLANGELSGTRENGTYPIKDDEDILAWFARIYAEANGGAQTPTGTDAAKKITHAVLSNAAWWGEDLSTIKGLEDAVAEYLDAIWKIGIKGVITGKRRNLLI
jgi:tagaturonate reductase